MRAITILIIMTGLWVSAVTSPVQAQVTAEEICSELSGLGQSLPSSCTQVGEPETKPVPPAVGPDGSLTAETRESHIFFAGGGTGLDDAARTQLGQLVAVLETPPLQDACLRLVGHSDASGGADLNKEIAQNRASVVADILRAGLTDPGRVKEVVSAGEDHPLIGLSPEAPQQRRVAIMARKCS